MLDFLVCSFSPGFNCFGNFGNMTYTNGFGNFGVFFGKIGNFFINSMLLWYLDFKPGSYVIINRHLHVREITVLFIFSSLFPFFLSIFFWTSDLEFIARFFEEKAGYTTRRRWCHTVVNFFVPIHFFVKTITDIALKLKFFVPPYFFSKPLECSLYTYNTYLASLPPSTDKST